MIKRNKRMLWVSLTLLPLMAVAMSLTVVACSKTTPTPTPTPDPEPDTPDVPTPPEPDTPDVDSTKLTINTTYLENLIQTNELGYNADALTKTIKKMQTLQNSDFLNNIFTDKKISSWNDVKDLNVVGDDAKGTVVLSFAYGGTHTYAIELTKDNGLLSDAYYYERMDDVSFAYRISYASVVSKREFPVFDTNGNCIKNNDALARAGFIDKQLASKNGTWLDKENNYVKEFNVSGTAWLVDYLPNMSASEQDFYEFIVATNVHVADLSDAFYANTPSASIPDVSNGVALDPLYINVSWAKHNGVLDYTQPNSFTDDNFVDTRNNIKNLSFQVDQWANGLRETRFRNEVLKNEQRLTKPDNEVFSTWDHPIGEQAIKQKQTLLENISFYDPDYTTMFDFSQSYLSDYWRNELKDSQIEYTNLQPDLTFLKVQLNKSDVASQWPKLSNAIAENRMDTYLMPLKTDVMKPEDDVAYYYAGNPYYSGVDPEQSNAGKREKLNGFDYKNHHSGYYYRSGKVMPHIFDNNGVEQKFNVWPNIVDMDLINPEDAGIIVGAQARKFLPISGDETDPLYINWLDKRENKKWAPYNQKTMDDTTLKLVYVNTKSEWLNSKIRKDPYITPEYNTEFYASSETRGMIKRSLNGMKKYWWGSSEYSMGGNSGSIVLSPKLEIGGIISSRKEGPDANLVKQVLIESMVNPATNIISGEKIIAEGVSKQLKAQNIYSVLYNKKS